jgi:hypothetical protein
VIDQTHRPTNRPESPDGTRRARAAEIIGTGASGDYVIAPAEHALLYRDAAPKLAELLSRDAVKAVAQRYQETDKEALTRQSTFRSVSGRAAGAVFLTATATALLLVGGSLGTQAPGWLTKTVIVASTAGAVVAAALGRAWIQRLKDGRLLEKWMTERARAESTRLEYFEQVSRAELEGLDPLLQFEYFRRYQLDVQRSFYRHRGEQHRRHAERALSHSSSGMLCGAVASAIAGLAGMIHPGLAALAAVALVGQAWAARAINAEATAQSRRNAERYDRTSRTLEKLSGRVDHARTAIADGDRVVLRDFVDAVHEQLSLEHRQWLEEMEAVDPALARLEEQLLRYREQGSAPAPGG